jgi:hypothetical protein
MIETNKDKINLFIDSGAFSAWSLGIKITIEEYITFIKRFNDAITVYANLDVIGNVEGTWRNQKIMEDAGLHPLPVYHIEDPIEYLDKCLEYDYFCLGGMAKGYSTHERTKFLDKCFTIICNTKNHMPLAKVHGFGVTGYSLITRYPWYSVDSTTWANFAAYGQVIVPPRRNKKWCYSEPFGIYRLSVRPSTTKNELSMLNTWRDEERKNFLDYVEEKGFDLGESKLVKDEEVMVRRGLCNDSKLRCYFNALYFLDLAAQMPPWPWAFIRTTDIGFDFKKK